MGNDLSACCSGPSDEESARQSHQHKIDTAQSEPEIEPTQVPSVYLSGGGGKSFYKIVRNRLGKLLFPHFGTYHAMKVGPCDKAEKYGFPQGAMDVLNVDELPEPVYQDVSHVERVFFFICAAVRQEEIIAQLSAMPNLQHVILGVQGNAPGAWNFEDHDVAAVQSYLDKRGMMSQVFSLTTDEAPCEENWSEITRWYPDIIQGSLNDAQRTFCFTEQPSTMQPKNGNSTAFSRQFNIPTERSEYILWWKNIFASTLAKIPEDEVFVMMLMTSLIAFLEEDHSDKKHGEFVDLFLTIKTAQYTEFSKVASTESMKILTTNLAASINDVTKGVKEYDGAALFKTLMAIAGVAIKFDNDTTRLMYHDFAVACVASHSENDEYLDAFKMKYSSIWKSMYHAMEKLRTFTILVKHDINFDPKCDDYIALCILSTIIKHCIV